MHRAALARTALLVTLASAALVADPFSVRASAAQSVGSVSSGEHSPPGTRLRRVVMVFDFEEPDNPDPVPRDWFRAQEDLTSQRDGEPVRVRPNFPPYNQAVFDDLNAASGRRSVRLPVRGGSASLRLRHGVLPVFSGADYSVTAQVRTQGAEHSRAFLTARLLDAASREIPGSERRSPAAQSEGRWASISVDLPGEYPDAAFLQIDLELLQARQTLPRGLLGRHHVWPEDLAASANFDDVAVHLLPRVELRTDSPDNVFRSPERPRLTALIRDLVADDLRAEFVVADIHGRVAAMHDSPESITSEPVPWTPDLPEYGWYVASLRLRSGDDVVAQASVPLAWLPDRATDTAESRADRARFGVIADGLAPGDLPAVPALIRSMGTGFVHLPAWQPESTAENAAQITRSIQPTLDALLADQQAVTLCLPGVPADAVSRLDLNHDDPLSLLSRNESEWLPMLMPLLDDYALRLPRWNIGRVGAAEVSQRADLPGDLAKFLRVMSPLVPGLIPSVSWDAELPAPRGLSGVGMTISFPVHFPAHTAAEWTSAAMHESGGDLTPTIVLDSLPSPTFAHADAVADVVKRAVEFWAVNPPGPGGARFAIVAPWTPGRTRGERARPDPLLPVWTHLVSSLSGRRVLGRFPAPQGVKCFILAEVSADSTPRRGALIAWNESALDADAVIGNYLGDGRIVSVDPFGNVMVLRRGSEGGETSETIRPFAIPRTPVFIEGIDPMVALFAAGFAVEPTFVPAVSAEHQHWLVLRNPWPARINGLLQVRRGETGEPPSWVVSPRGVLEFAIDPGQSVRLPLVLSFGPADEAGTKELSVVARVQADRPLPPIRLQASLELGLEDIELSPDFVLVPSRSADGQAGTGGFDVHVMATVTNRGLRPRSMRVEAVAKGYASQSMHLGSLAPGQTALRRFVFPGGAERLSGKRVVVGVAEVDGPQRISRSLRIP